MKRPPARQYARLALITAAAVLVTYLLTRHQLHTLQLLPWVVLLACPLMHLFMHGEHRHQHHEVGDKRPELRDPTVRQG